MTTGTPPQPCPACGHKIELATSVGGDFRPTPGDLTLCVQCAGVLLFGNSLELLVPTADETTLLRRSSKWPLVARTIRAILRAKGRGR